MKKSLKLLAIISFIIILPVSAFAEFPIPDSSSQNCPDGIWNGTYCVPIDPGSPQSVSCDSGFHWDGTYCAQDPAPDIIVSDPGSSQGPFQGPCPDGSTVGPTGGCASSPVSDNIGDFIFRIQQILNSILPVLIALGVVYFVWGVVIYVIGNDEEAKKKGKDRMIYGIIGFAVIIALWGLVFIVVDTFDLDASAPSISALGTGSGSGCNFINNNIRNPNAKFQDLLCYIIGIINDSVIPLIFALAVVVFVWGTVNFFILNSDDEKKREQGRQFMIWGIVALAVMLSVWGLVRILGATFNFTTSVLPRVTPPPP